MLFFSSGEREIDRMGEVNQYLHEHDTLRRQQFSDTDSIDDKWYGGSKFLEAPLWGAAFNHVDHDIIMDAIRSANWKYPGDVILMWNGQEDYAWQPIYVMPDGLSSIPDQSHP